MKKAVSTDASKSQDGSLPLSTVLVSGEEPADSRRDDQSS
jgi:hypothetical protein